MENQNNLLGDRRFQALVENSLDAVALLDGAGHVVYTSPSRRRVLGYPPGALDGRAFTEIVHPDDHGHTGVLFASLLKSPDATVTEMIRCRHQTGDWRWIEFVAHNLLHDPELAAVVVNYRDVTDRKRAEEERKERDQLLTYVVTNARCILWHAVVTEVDRERAIYDWDLHVFDEEAAQRFFPLPMEPGESFTRAWYRSKDAGDRQLMDRLAHQALQRGDPGYLQAYRCTQEHGEVRWVQEQTSIEPLAPGRWRLAGVCTDITERKRAEEALQEADRRKDEFLAMLAHELRNPLGPVLNAVQLMRARGSGPELAPAQAVIERQVHQMARLVDDLLDASRLSHGRMELRKAPLDLAPLIQRVVEAAAPLIRSRNHHVTLSLQDPSPRLSADPLRLEQIVSNLLHNAIKYTDPGGQICLDLAIEGENAVLRVRDTGIGIPADLLPQVFDLFTQGDRSLDRSQGGLGIGLTLVKSLVGMHGGAIRAASAGPGKGAEFTVTLPMIRPDQVPPAAGAPGETPAEAPAEASEEVPEETPARTRAARRGKNAVPGQPVRILVVDDSPDMTETVRDLLHLWGYEVRVVHDGISAVPTARDWKPVVVILDIGLPGMNGYEVASWLRQDPATADSRIITVSGYGSDDDRRRSLEAGADMHLTKPVDPVRLRELLGNS